MATKPKPKRQPVAQGHLEPGFHPALSVDEIKGAPYNPRRIQEAQFAALQESLRQIGVVKAVIATTDGTLIAGHQRTKAMRSIGLTTTPAYVLRHVTQSDEIKFNQLHNASDANFHMSGLRFTMRDRGPGWHVIPPEDIEILGRPRAAAKIMEIGKLLTKHGEWGNAVLTASGRVVGSQLYAYAVAIMAQPLRVCVVPDELGDAVERFLNGEYGEFSYDHLPKQTWVQSLKQPMRLRQDDIRDESRMWLYEVLPRVTKSMRILDFGAGQMDYVKRLQGEGYDIRGVEFFYRTKGAMAIDTRAVHQHIDALCQELHDRGLFDVVTCDSVLNSVDSKKAERNVCLCVAGLTRPGGISCLTGHSREEHDRREHEARTVTGMHRLVNFYDADGFTGMFDRGVWSYQLYHTKEDALALGHTYLSPDTVYNREGGWFSIRARRSIEHPQEVVEQALWDEFEELPWPDGKKVGRGADILAAYRAAVAKNV
jgi:ParB family chromosome partitioning protein